MNEEDASYGARSANGDSNSSSRSSRNDTAASSAPATPAHHARFGGVSTAESKQGSSSSGGNGARSSAMQSSYSDSALLTSSSSSSANSSAHSSFNNSSESESEESKINKVANAALNSPLLQKHKPSWGEIPTPTSMNSSTSFSFGQSPSLPSSGSSLSPSIINGSSANGYMSINGTDGSSGSSTPTPKAEKEDPTRQTMKSGGLEEGEHGASAPAQPSTKMMNGGEPFLRFIAFPLEVYVQWKRSGGSETHFLNRFHLRHNNMLITLDFLLACFFRHY